MQGFIHRIFFTVVANILFAVTLSAQQMTLSQVTTHLTDQPLAFTKNMGQWPDSILFRANANGAVMWFTKDGVYQQFFKRIPSVVGQDSCSPDIFDSLCQEHRAPDLPRPIPDKFGHERDSIETMMIKTTFVASNIDVAIETGEILEYKCNYFLGNDSTKWATDVPNYSSITYKNIYSGIDLRYYGNGKRMEYDFIVSPGADPMAIKLRYDNVESVTYAENGDLVVKTKWSDIIEQAPVVYSQYQHIAKPVNACFTINADNTFAFVVDDYDKTQTIILDPVLVYSTYLGGSGSDGVASMAIDSLNNVYLVGSTMSSDFPLLDPFDNTLNSERDIFVTKFSMTVNSILYSTFLGGASNEEYGDDIALDKSSNAYITGVTGSPDFPTINAFDSTYNRVVDAYVTKLSATGNSLVYSTYLGGSQADDHGRGIGVDQFDNAYVAGVTQSTDFPVKNAYDSTAVLFDYRCFITKFSATGTDLVFSSFLDGNGWDECLDMEIDQTGDVYLVGGTSSLDFPIKNAYDSLGGSASGFITKFSSDGDSIEYSTFFSTVIYAIGLDLEQNIYIAGWLGETPDFPFVNAYDSTFNGEVDIFAAKFTSLGDSIIFSTYLGGDEIDYISTIAADTMGNMYLAGGTYSSNFPQWNSLDTTMDGNTDVFITKLSASGSMMYSTFWGGSGSETSGGILVDDSANIYVAGGTSSIDFPISNPFDSLGDLASDGFIAKFVHLPDCCTGIRDDVNNSGGVNVLDLNYLVAYFFAGGTAPVCLDEANANGSGPINVLDLHYLVDYFFTGGPAPVACP